MTKALTTLADLTQDDQNANKGTKRGGEILEQSLARYGAGRSLLADKDGQLIAGNKTHQKALKLGMRAKIVDIEPDEILVARRPDLDLDSETDTRARELAYADNLAGFEDLAWDAQQMHSDAQRIDLSDVGFSAKDLEAHFRQFPPAINFQSDEPAGALPAAAPADVAPAQDGPELAASADQGDIAPASEYVRMVQLFLTTEQFERFHEIVDRIKAATGAINHTEATMAALERWAEALEGGQI